MDDLKNCLAANVFNYYHWKVLISSCPSIKNNTINKREKKEFAVRLCGQLQPTKHLCMESLSFIFILFIDFPDWVPTPIRWTPVTVEGGQWAKFGTQRTFPFLLNKIITRIFPFCLYIWERFKNLKTRYEDAGAKQQHVMGIFRRGK